MTDAPYGIAHVSEIVTPSREEPGSAPWRAVRRHFDIGLFGIALERGTTLLPVRSEPGKAFEVSQWERRDEDDA